MLLVEEGRLLVTLVRRVVFEVCNGNYVVEAPDEVPENLKRKMGAFVIINEFNKPVGVGKRIACVGYPIPSEPLVETVIDAAVNAAIRANISASLNAQSLNNVAFEVDILTPPEHIEVDRAVDYPKMLNIGRDGLLIELYFHKSVLLPQIPVEEGWDEMDYLIEGCLRAGLPADSWLRDDIRIYKFQTEIFKEVEPKGEVVKIKLRYSE